MTRHLKPGIIALMLALLVVLSACTADDDVFEPVGETDPVAATSPADAGNDTAQNVVELDILEGPNGSVVVFVPIYIQGEGPFDFVLDTGASRTVIDESVSALFDLPEIEEVGDVTGVGGTTVANLVEIRDWRMGDTVELPEMQVTAFAVFDDQEVSGIEAQLGREIQGLLGSDVLAAFGVITLDFENAELIVNR